MAKLNPLELSTECASKVNIALPIRVSKFLLELNELALPILFLLNTFFPHDLDAANICFIG
jgi:hypothetical protein